MRHILIHAIAHAVVYLQALLASAAPPKLSLTASKATTSGGTSINVARDERVTIRIAAEPGSTIVIFCRPKTVYITPSNKSEVTFYAAGNTWWGFSAVKDGETNQQEIDVIVSGGPLPPVPPDPGPTPPTPGPVPTSELGKAIYTAAEKCASTTKLADCQTMIAELGGFRAQLVATKSASIAVDESKIKEESGGFTFLKPALLGGKKSRVFKTKEEAIRELSNSQIVAGIITAMLSKIPEPSKGTWKVPLVTYYALPLSKVVIDKASGIKAIDETILGLKAVR